MSIQRIRFERIKNLVGRPDEEPASNRLDLEAAKAVLRSALEQELTGRQLECVRLYYFDGLTQEEAALALGISKSTVCRHLKKAKVRLKKALGYGEKARRVLARGEEA